MVFGEVFVVGLELLPVRRERAQQADGDFRGTRLLQVFVGARDAPEEFELRSHYALHVLTHFSSRCAQSGSTEDTSSPLALHSLHESAPGKRHPARRTNEYVRERK